MKRTFTCPQCRAKFAWKDAYLNRKVSCRCGAVFEAFEDVPEEVEIDPYDVAADEERAPVAPASAIAPPRVQPIGAPPPGVALSPYPARARRAVESEPAVDESSPLLNLILPGVLLAAGVGIIIAQGALDPQQGSTSLRTILMSVLFMGIMIVTMLAGGALSAILLGTEFGTLGKVIWKFAGIATFAASVGVVVAGLDPDPMAIRGKIIALHVVVILYWIGFQTLFELDLQENLLSVAIITLLQSLAACVLWRL
jgi:hypothetical protein